MSKGPPLYDPNWLDWLARLVDFPNLPEGSERRRCRSPYFCIHTYKWDLRTPNDPEDAELYFAGGPILLSEPIWLSLADQVQLSSSADRLSSGVLASAVLGNPPSLGCCSGTSSWPKRHSTAVRACHGTACSFQIPHLPL